MKIKNLEQAEALPMKSSMRKSSDYDSWECNRYGNGYYRWVMRFIGKNVGRPFDLVYSEFKEAVRGKHFSKKIMEEVIDHFRWLTNGSERYQNYYYVDDDGNIQEKSRRRKNRNRTVNYGKPEYMYFFDERYLFLERYLVMAFGYRKAWEFMHTSYHNSIPFGELFGDCNPSVRRFNNLCRENGVKESEYSYGYLNFNDLWVKWVKYPYTETYKYRSREYYRLHYEGKSLRRKYERERTQELIDKFNRLELRFNVHPILIT